MLAMLLVVCIVALLAGTVLRQYGLGGATAPRAPRDTSTSETVGGIAPAAPDVTVPAPLDAVGRARGVEDAVRQQAAEYGRRIEAGTK
jgi:hypothetical protein